MRLAKYTLRRMFCTKLTAFAAASVLSFCALPADAQQSSPANGFYIRGDVGAGFAESTTFTDTRPNGPDCLLCKSLLPVSTGNSVIFGAGVGYRFNSMFRADVTFDYLPSLKVSGGWWLGPLRLSGHAGLDSLVGLVNGYVDLDGVFPNTFGSFQPYLTAGLGFARDDLDTFSGSAGSASGITPFTLTGSTQMNFAWALGAGIGYALTSRWTVDVAYKYLDLGQLRTDTTLGLMGMTIPLSAIKSGNLDVHTVTLGVRYAF